MNGHFRSSGQWTGQGSQHTWKWPLESGFIPKAVSPTHPYRRPKSTGFRAKWYLLCDILFFFFHTHFLLINTFLPQHRSWQGLAGSEYFEYLPNCPPRAYSPSCSACECRSSSRAAQEMTLGFGFDRNLPTSVFFPPHGVYSQPVLKFRKNLHSLMSN